MPLLVYYVFFAGTLGSFPFRRFYQTAMMAENQEANKEGVSEPAQIGKEQWPFRKARKHALMLSFSGKNYLGMQINNPHPTIEADLWKAMFKAGVVSQDWVDDPPAAHFQRASRTDKGVSAMRMIVSLKMCK